MSDQEIIQRVLAGERGLYKELVLRYQTPLLRYLKAFGVSSEIIEEMTQEALTQAFFKLATYDATKAQFFTWLVTIAKNKMFTHLKVQRTQNQKSIEDGIDEQNPLTHMENCEDKDRVLKALQQIPLEFKNTVILFFINELSLSEIAVIEKCSLGTVKSRLFRGKEMIKKHLAKDLVYEKSV